MVRVASEVHSQRPVIRQLDAEVLGRLNLGRQRSVDPAGFPRILSLRPDCPALSQRG
jgi:hypothetical protein